MLSNAYDLMVFTFSCLHQDYFYSQQANKYNICYYKGLTNWVSFTENLTSIRVGIVKANKLKLVGWFTLNRLIIN